MALDHTLPFDLLTCLPSYLHSIEDLLSLSSTSRALYRTCANPSPNEVLRLAASSGRVFFRPHPHILIAATARQVADWAVQHDDRRHQLEVAIQGGVDELLALALRVAGLTMDDIRRLWAFKCDVLNVVNRKLDLEAGPATERAWTVCNDPETTLLTWIIYGELFHHTLELAYLSLPAHKPLSTVIRYKWFVFCVPDENCFRNMGLKKEERPHFFQQYIQEETDRFQQLSMITAGENVLCPSSWENALETCPTFQALAPELREQYLSAVMHMGFKSLEILVPGGSERVKGDLDRVADGIATLLHDDAQERLREFAGDPWLLTPFVTLKGDLWASWDLEGHPLQEVLRSAAQKMMTIS